MPYTRRKYGLDDWDLGFGLGTMNNNFYIQYLMRDLM